MSDRFYNNYNRSSGGYNYPDYKSSSNSFLRHSQSGARQQSWNEELQKKLSGKNEHPLDKIQRLEKEYDEKNNDNAGDANSGKGKYEFLRHTIDYQGKGFTPDEYGKTKNRDHYQSNSALRKYTADEQDDLGLQKKYSKTNFNYSNVQPKEIDFLARDYYYKSKKSKPLTQKDRSSQHNEEELNYQFPRTAKSPRHRIKTEGEYSNANMSYSGHRGYAERDNYYSTSNYPEETELNRNNTYGFEKKYENSAKFNKKPSYHYYTPKSESQSEVTSPQSLKSNLTSSLEIESPVKKPSSVFNHGSVYDSKEKISRIQTYSPIKPQKFSGSRARDEERRSTDPSLNLEKINVSLKAREVQDFKTKPPCLDDFEVGKFLGQGKFGNVYLVVHKKTRFMFALKKVKKDQIKQHKLENQFMMEIKMQIMFNHKNILRLYGFFDDETYIYLILEYMEGGTLFNSLKKEKKMSQSDASHRMNQVLQAIQYLHDEHQVAHRDLKPENIVISNGVCKICDFGWAADCSKRRTTLVGTLDYVATQVLNGMEYGLEIDLWCLGVLCYELLVGKAPFYHAKVKETMKKIVNADTSEIKIPSEMSSQAKDFISRLIVKDPDQRMTAKQALTHDFILNHREEDMCVSPTKE